MNNVTISDLSEKSTLEDTDLFLVRDSNDADMKIKGKVFADKITDSLSGYTKDNDTLSTLNTASKKPVNSSAVNSALTNYQRKNYATLTSPQDANNATSNGIVNSYRVSQACSNIPIAKIGILTVYGYVNGSYHRTTQEYITNDETKDVKKYIREGYSNNNGSTWNWGEWQQLATESSVNTTLTNYAKYVYKANEQITQNVTKVIDLTNKVEKGRNYKIVILANYNAVYYFEGIMSLNYSTNKFQIIPIVSSEFTITSTEAYKINIDYARNTSNYSISIIEC